MIAALACPAVLTDMDGVVLRWNASAEAQLPLSSSRATGRPLWSLLPVDLAEVLRAHLRKNPPSESVCLRNPKAFPQIPSSCLEVEVVLLRDEARVAQGYLHLLRVGPATIGGAGSVAASAQQVEAHPAIRQFTHALNNVFTCIQVSLERLGEVPGLPGNCGSALQDASVSTRRGGAVGA